MEALKQMRTRKSGKKKNKPYFQIHRSSYEMTKDYNANFWPLNAPSTFQRIKQRNNHYHCKTIVRQEIRTAG